MVKSASAVAITVVCCSVTIEARVTRIEIAKAERFEPPSPGGQAAIQIPYERISGKFYGELDPADPKNALITDIQFAPLNARGKVEYVGTFSMMKPIDLSKASGVLMYSVVNRGNGAAAASPDGHISLVSGWQGDVVPTATNQAIQGFFAGVTHGGGRGGFSSAETAAADCVLPANPAPSAPMRSALMKAFVAWVTKGTPMPPSRYPTIADGTLVQNTTAAMGFPKIPGKPSPEHLVHPLFDYDLGAGFNYQDASGFLTAVPHVKRSLPQLVVKVDADGNEVAGIKSPLQMAPLGTYTGWNLMASGPLKGQVCGNLGGFIPFAKTKAERLASGDPRLSLEERYRSHEDYVAAVGKAVSRLQREGYLLDQDAEAMIKQAKASDVLR